MAHNKLYTASIIKELQNAVNTNKIIITPYKDYSFLTPGIKSCGSLIRFYIDKSSGKPSKMINMASDLTTELHTLWKSYSINKFLFNDWKNNKKDFVENTVYSEIKFTTSSGEQLKVLVRKLEEISENILNDQEKLEFIKEYCDLIIDGRYFTVIKIQPYYDDDQYWLMDDKSVYITFTFDNIIPLNSTSSEVDDNNIYNDNLNDNNEALF